MKLTYQDWENGIADDIRQDVLWKLTMYRLSLFAADIAWQDITKLMKDKRTVRIAEQLYRAIGSISPTLQKVIPEAGVETGHVFMNMRWVQLAKAVIGITNPNTYLEIW